MPLFFNGHRSDDTRSAAQGIPNSVFLLLCSSAGHKSGNDSLWLEAHPCYLFDTKLTDIPLYVPLLAHSRH